MTEREDLNRKLEQYLDCVRFTPKFSAGRKIDRKALFNNLQLMPGQYAYIMDISEGSLPFVKGIKNTLGYEENNLPFGFIFKIIHPDDQDRMFDIVTRAFDYGRSIHKPSPYTTQFMISYRVKTSDGITKKVFRQSTILECDDDGKMVSTLSIVTDISSLDSGSEIKFEMKGEFGSKFVVPDLNVPRPDLSSLTTAETQLLKLISEGASTKEIAERLQKSSHTIDTQRKNMLKKFSMNNTFQLIFWAKEQGMI